MTSAINVELRPDQEDRLRAIAQSRNMSVADLIREGVDRLLAEVDVERVPLEDDPILQIIGLVEGGPSDMAERHDDYLAETLREDRHG
jgi:hypothetical protein